MTFICSPNGSCAFATGDLNVVLQRSTDGGRTWGPIIHVSPGFPASGGDSAPLLVEPGGRIDLEYQSYHILNRTTYAMSPRTPTSPRRLTAGRRGRPLYGWDRAG